MDAYASSYNPTICVTHRCNLSCVYCYQQNHNNKDITYETAIKCVDFIMENVPDYAKTICLSFIGGEPLLMFDLISELYEYIFSKYNDNRLVLFATTNGTLLNKEMKKWFYERKDKFILGLSLDGDKKTQDYNRSNSFDSIDIPFFVKTWPNQGIKMTISQKSIESLADNIVFLHNQGFKYINGVNLAEGDFDWSDDSLIEVLSEQLSKLVTFYEENPHLNLDQTFGKHIELCSINQNQKKKVCGIGGNTIFFDVDGKQYPCSYVTPMTFSDKELNEIQSTDFSNSDLFVDDDCRKNCYLYPICPNCYGANYLVNHTFSKRIKSKCKLIKIMSLYIAELHMRRILKNPSIYADQTYLYHMIESIKGIRERYFEDFKNFMTL